MRTINSLIVLSSLSFVTACSDDGSPSRTHGQINSGVADSTVASMTELRAAMADGDGESVAGEVMSMTALGQALVVPAGAYGRVAPAAFSLAPHVSRDHASFTGSVSCDATGCVYDNFGDDNESASFRINGFVREVGDTVSIDLTYEASVQGYAFTWNIDGNLTISPTVIDGYIHSSGGTSTTTAEGYNLSWNVALDFESIGLDGGGCPVSGRLSASIDYSAATNGGDAGGYAVTGAVSFGPTCGQYTIE